MCTRTNKHTAAADIAFQFHAVVVLNHHHAAGIAEFIVQHPQRNAVVVARPDHVGNQGNPHPGRFQDILDKTLVVFQNGILVFLVFHNQWADVDADGVALLEPRRQGQLNRIQRKGGVGVQLCVFANARLQQRVVCDGFPRGNQGVAVQVLEDFRIFKQFRLDGTAPQHRFFPLPVQPAVGVRERFRKTRATIIIPADGKAHRAFCPINKVIKFDSSADEMKPGKNGKDKP